MKGKIGTPMVVEYKPRKKGVHCKNCKWLVCGGEKTPYTCSLKHKGRHYTSVCICNRFVKKEIISDSEKHGLTEEQEKARKAWLERAKNVAKEKRKMRKVKKEEKE